MFSLSDELVSSVEINGRLYEVDMSFDNILRLVDMLNDNELDDLTQILTGIEMLFDQPLDCPIEEQAEIFNQAYFALIGFDDEKELEYDLLGNLMPGQEEDESKDTVYDIRQDAEYIYASFMQDYGIDLIEQQGKLHWYKFKALLSGLREDTKFKKVIEIRQMPLPTGRGSGKYRKEVEELKKAYALKPL
ncbi:bacteriophage Gp15 family protein [Lysinibacillus sp.]|uniref:bacteriophage Gp15 family protein n=1 Tax=Lysinibacillus sp. TaxID=1869345 RepID=UPI0028ABE068|nr:bacteriophage Gp15 family protein [Lysinibacillus sp.]